MAVCNASLNMNGNNEADYGAQPQAMNLGIQPDTGYQAAPGSIQSVNSGYYGAQMPAYTNPPLGTAACDDGDDCVQVIRTVKRVVVPCKRNVVKNITVQVPRTIVNKVPKQMPYQDVEKRVRSVPYITHKEEVRYTNTNQPYTTMVPRIRTKMVPVTRRVPKTVYVNETTTVPRQETVMVPEIRQRNVRIPYKVQVPETKYRNQTYHVPVTKYKTVYEDVPKTIYEPRTKQQCTTVTKMVAKDIPVYSAIPRKPPICPPQPVVQSNLGRDFTAADTNHDGVLNLEEYTNARQAGLLQETAAPVGPSYSTAYQLAQQAPTIASSEFVGTNISRRYHPSDLEGPDTPTPQH
jgi:hypothetical protein